MTSYLLKRLRSSVSPRRREAESSVGIMASTGSGKGDELTRIEQAERVESLFDGAHCVELGRRSQSRELGDLRAGMLSAIK